MFNKLRIKSLLQTFTFKYLKSTKYLTSQNFCPLKSKSFYSRIYRICVPIGVIYSAFVLCESDDSPDYLSIVESYKILLEKLESGAISQKWPTSKLYNIYKDINFISSYHQTNNGGIHGSQVKIKLPDKSKNSIEFYKIAIPCLNSFIDPSVSKEHVIAELSNKGEAILSDLCSISIQKDYLIIHKDFGLTKSEISDLYNFVNILFENKTNSSEQIEKLKSMGIKFYDCSNNLNLNWDFLAGYDHVKKEIEDTVINSLKYPEVYDKIVKQTREHFEENACRPKAILFEGLPGTGKSLTARIIASQVDRPFVYISTEEILSKWYGESEKNLGKIFELCETLDEGAIIFIDEIDALASSRDDPNMHEATKRILSVILQKVEGFHSSGKSTLICATNRKLDLDSALLSRFDLTIKFGLPSYMDRVEIFKRYAKQLSGEELKFLSELSEGLSCRDLKDACKHAERKWAGKVINNEVDISDRINSEVYVDCVQRRKNFTLQQNI